MVFYQTALLAGYWYAGALTRYLPVPRQVLVHAALVICSLALLPVGAGAVATPGTAPPFTILRILTFSIGLPFALLSATSPLLQQWLTQQNFKTPYVLFALSNTASLSALLAYPTLIEPAWDLGMQRRVWSGGYVVFALLCLASAWFAARHAGARQQRNTFKADLQQRLLWFLLAACGSMLLLSITNHITQNVAAVPLLWVVPLALYLLTFMLSFAHRRFYNRRIWLRILAMSLGLIGYAIYDIRVVEAIQISLPVFLFGLFAGCLFCHGELAQLRPPAEGLTVFYLLIAIGGAAGAVFVGLLAPVLFNGVYELPFTLIATAALAAWICWSEREWLMRLLWSGMILTMIAVLAENVVGYRENSLVLERSFYGSLRVVQTPIVSEHQTRMLFHGTIKHGAEFLWPTLRNRPTAYYGPDSGIGILLRECYPGRKTVGIVGLGTGTVAAYGQAGDTFHFFEINPQVVSIAQGLFYFLRESPARIEVSVGDGRLELQRQPLQKFDVLAVDAFSGDAIPVHLLTEEAFALYRQRLQDGGTLAVHVSNQYLDLAPIVQLLAQRNGWQAVQLRNHADVETHVDASDWVLATNNPAVLENPSVRTHEILISLKPGARPWTDSYNDLLETLRTPKLSR